MMTSARVDVALRKRNRETPATRSERAVLQQQRKQFNNRIRTMERSMINQALDDLDEFGEELNGDLEVAS